MSIAGASGHNTPAMTDDRTTRNFYAHLPALRAALLDFYRAHKRQLPWRNSRDPYAIWVSEIMLQQTQVSTVVPRYLEFLREFPSVQALAAATEHRVCEAWAGLGYYRRARHLHAAARAVLAEHGGVLPADVAALQRLPGIGRYTAGAIASIAYAVPAPIVDGNVVRVLSRLCTLTESPESGEGKRALWSLATDLVQGDDPGDLNQALMELGATVCTPIAPTCRTCPVRAFCGATRQGTPERYPTPTVKAERKALNIAFAWLRGPEGLWLRRRPLDGLWAGLWELPSEAGAAAKSRLAASLGVRFGLRLAVVSHELTHRRVTATIYASNPAVPTVAPTEDFLPYPRPLDAPLSALARKAILAVESTRLGRHDAP